MVDSRAPLLLGCGTLVFILFVWSQMNSDPQARFDSMEKHIAELSARMQQEGDARQKRLEASVDALANKLESSVGGLSSKLEASTGGLAGKLDRVEGAVNRLGDEAKSQGAAQHALLASIASRPAVVQQLPAPPPEPAVPPPPPPPSPTPVPVPDPLKPSVNHALWWRAPGSTGPHEPLMRPKVVGYMDAYTNVSTRPGRSNVLFAYREKDCNDANKHNPTILFQGNVMGAILASIPRGGVVVDIGACYGDTGVPLAAMIGDRVIAYEPNPESFAVLQYNSRLNPDLRIEPHNFAAAGDTNTTSMEFTYAGDMCNGGNNFGLKHQASETKLTVAATHIPTHLATTYGEGIYDEITFIKTDTEGFDHFVLKSLAPILKRNPKIIIMVEWFDWFVSKHEPVNTWTPQMDGGEDIHPKAQELFDEIDKAGYVAYEPYTMAHIPGPQNKYKVPDLTLLPKGMKPWKAGEAPGFPATSKVYPPVIARTPPPAELRAVSHQFWTRAMGTDTTHEHLKQPKQVGYIDAYTNVVDRPGRSNVLFAYREKDCNDWNKHHPAELFTGNVIAAILASIPRGGVVVDIGACYGDTGVPLAALIADRVIAYEPNPDSFAVLEYNSRLNPDLRIEPHNFAAAGDMNTTSMEFTYAGDMCNGGNNFGMQHQASETKLTVAATHIPTHLAKTYGEGIYDEITFIKTDTEGFDHFVLKSLAPILKRNPKIIIMVEWFDHFVTKHAPVNTWEAQMDGGEDIHPKAQELFDEIEKAGYVAYEPYSMRVIPGPQNKFKVADMTLLPKGMQPWKAGEAPGFPAK